MRADAPAAYFSKDYATARTLLLAPGWIFLEEATDAFDPRSERQIFDKPRFRQVSTLYGYLAKQFTIFGQHVHIGCDLQSNGRHLFGQQHADIARF